MKTQNILTLVLPPGWLNSHTNITQVGIRAQCKEEYEFIKEKGIKTFYAFEIHNNKYGKNWEDKVIRNFK